MSGLERGVRIIDRQSRSEETWHQEVKQHRMAELFFLKLNSSVRFLISCFSQQFPRRTLYKIRQYQATEPPQTCHVFDILVAMTS